MSVDAALSREAINTRDVVQGLYPTDALGGLDLELRLDGVRIVKRRDPDLHHAHLVERRIRVKQAGAEDQRKLWLQTAGSIFKMIYKDSDFAPVPAKEDVWK